MERSLFTPEGHARLVAEIKHAKAVLRPQIVKDIEEARAHGDISENSEFEDAKERQAHLNGRILHLQGLMATAEVIDIKAREPADLVVFGATVDLINLDTDEEVTYTILGKYEADVKLGRISYSAPIGRALIGKSSGDEVNVKTPAGLRSYEVVAVHYR